MFTLSNKKTVKSTFIIYCAVVTFCVTFGIIYEMYSHGVVSFFTLFGFLFPCILGLLPYLVLLLFFREKGPGTFASYSYNAGVATVTVGSYFKGMLDIYGTTRDSYVSVYFFVGASLIIVGIIIYSLSLAKAKQNNENN